MGRMSALGWVRRTVLISGSSTGFIPPLRVVPSRARRRRTAAVPLAPSAAAARAATPARVRVSLREARPE